MHMYESEGGGEGGPLSWVFIKEIERDKNRHIEGQTESAR